MPACRGNRLAFPFFLPTARMSDSPSPSTEHLENAKDVVWEAVQMLEHAQRVLFRAGDGYVGQVWGDGVRSVLELTERLTDLTGDLTAVHIEIGRLVRKDKGRNTGPGG
jgi:hypothetical protein